MTYLGDFGIGHAPNDATFGFFGSPMRVHPDLSEVVLLDLFARIATAIGEEENVSDAVEAVRGIAATLVHPDDVDEFWRLAKAHRQRMEDIADIAMRLLEALTDRPTKRPSDSWDGPPPTDTSSADASSSPALRLLEGRPDLQVAVIRAEEARAASA